ncbi:hypothetical protein ACPA9J_18090 [Pseudomonas aeruginosa]
MVDLYRGLQEKQLAVLHRYVQEVAERCHLGGPCASCRSKRSWTRAGGVADRQAGSADQLSFTAPAASMPGRVPHRPGASFCSSVPSRSRRHSVVRLIPSRRCSLVEAALAAVQRLTDVAQLRGFADGVQILCARWLSRDLG